MVGLLTALALLPPPARAAEPSADWLATYDRIRVALSHDADGEAVAAARALVGPPDLSAPAAGVGDAADLAARRAAFGELSRQVILDLGADPAAPKVVAYHCPMFAAGFAWWVQPKPGIENPYMGVAMPDCGEQVSLKAAVRAAGER